MPSTTVESAERDVGVLALGLTSALPGECVFCYVDRMLDEFGCDTTLRWAVHWRDTRAPRATALERRLGSRGGFCDCEIFLNGWTPAAEVLVYDEETEEWRRPNPHLPCRGVRRGSSQSCGLWRPLLRDRWR